MLPLLSSYIFPSFWRNPSPLSSLSLPHAPPPSQHSVSHSLFLPTANTLTLPYLAPGLAPTDRPLTLHYPPCLPCLAFTSDLCFYLSSQPGRPHLTIHYLPTDQHLVLQRSSQPQLFSPTSPTTTTATQSLASRGEGNNPTKALVITAPPSLARQPQHRHL